MNEALNSIDSGTTLRTVERALQFMEFVAQSDQPPKIKNVATELNLNITTSYHLLKTLHKAGYVDRDRNGYLRIGRRVTFLHQGMIRQQSLGHDLHSVVAELSSLTLETAYLAVLTGDGLVIDALVESNQAVRVAGLHVGFNGAEHTRASGKAVLAFLSKVEREPILAKSLGEASIRNRRGIINSLSV